MTDLFAIAALLQVNPVRSKELTNIRAASKDENVKLSPPRLVCHCLPVKLFGFISFCFIFYLLAVDTSYCILLQGTMFLLFPCEIWALLP